MAKRLKFKIGDRVIVFRASQEMEAFRGATGKIVEIDSSDDTPYHVKFDTPVREQTVDWETMWFPGRELRYA